MKTWLRIVGWIVVVVVVIGVAAVTTARVIAGRKYNQTWVTHEVDFPIPFPLSEAELPNLRSARLQGGADPKDPLAGVDRLADCRLLGTAEPHDGAGQRHREFQAA